MELHFEKELEDALKISTRLTKEQFRTFEGDVIIITTKYDKNADLDTNYTVHIYFPIRKNPIGKTFGKIDFDDLPDEDKAQIRKDRELKKAYWG